jgi:tetratricopeptide (TPR) repeat protein
MSKSFRRITIVLALAVVCLIAACGPDFNNPLDPENSPDVRILVRDGWTSYEAGNVDAAIAKFRQATTQDAQNVEAYTGLGWSLFQNQDVQGAIDAFQRALAIDANAVDAHVGVAGAFLAAERYQSAVEHAQTALRLKPDYIFAHNPLITSKNLHLLLAQGYYYLGDFTQAIEEVNIIDPTIEVDSNNAASDLLRILEELTQRG